MNFNTPPPCVSALQDLILPITVQRSNHHMSFGGGWGVGGAKHGDAVSRQNVDFLRPAPSPPEGGD